MARRREVTLFASGDSLTKAKLVPAWPRALRLGHPRSDPAPAYAALLEAVAEAAASPRIVCKIPQDKSPYRARIILRAGRFLVPPLARVPTRENVCKLSTSTVFFCRLHTRLPALTCGRKPRSASVVLIGGVGSGHECPKGLSLFGRCGR